MLLKWAPLSQISVNPIQGGSPWGCSRIRGRGGGGAKKVPLPKICHTYPAMMNLAQLYLTQRRTKKYMNQVAHPFSSADISIFSPKITKFCCIKKHGYRLSFDTLFLMLLTFLDSLKIALINMVTILMRSDKWLL